MSNATAEATTCSKPGCDNLATEKFGKLWCYSHAPLYDEIESPKHYQLGAMQPIDAIEALYGKSVEFHVGTALVYMMRAGKKDGEPILKDLKKARWFLDRAIKQLEGAE